MRKGFCRSCFSAVCEKRIKRALRKRFRRGQKVLVVGSLAKHYFQKLIMLPLDITFRTFRSYDVRDREAIFRSASFRRDLARFDAVVLEWSLDDDISYFLSSVFSGGSAVFPGNIVRIFAGVPDDDLIFLSGGKGFRKGRRLAFHGLIESLEKSYPEVRNSFVRSIRLMERL
ncbi:hypothetical protein JW968_04855 [Candidatus Woesearchaeota archaeon]|nr:hypothetical protein [Candidatus Woesearchaeota archaeon]